MPDAITIGGIVGALIGVIAFLLRVLVVAKDKQIAALEAELQRVIAERDLFRDLTLTHRRD